MNSFKTISGWGGYPKINSEVISPKNLDEYKINLKNILGHSDISPDRKKDPGEKFPWKKLSNCGLANWHNLPESKLKKLRLVKLSQCV